MRFVKKQEKQTHMVETLHSLHISEETFFSLTISSQATNESNVNIVFTKVL